MPLVKSASKQAVPGNIRRERQAGKPQKQAVAIALDTQRRAKKSVPQRDGMRKYAQELNGRLK